MGIQVPILQITSLITGVEVSFFFIAGYFLKKHRRMYFLLTLGVWESCTPPNGGLSSPRKILRFLKHKSTKNVVHISSKCELNPSPKSIISE